MTYEITQADPGPGWPGSAHPGCQEFMAQQQEILLCGSISSQFSQARYMIGSRGSPSPLAATHCSFHPTFLKILSFTRHSTEGAIYGGYWTSYYPNGRVYNTKTVLYYPNVKHHITEPWGCHIMAQIILNCTF